MNLASIHAPYAMEGEELVLLYMRHTYPQYEWAVETVTKQQEDIRMIRYIPKERPNQPWSDYIRVQNYLNSAQKWADNGYPMDHRGRPTIHKRDAVTYLYG